MSPVDSFTLIDGPHNKVSLTCYCDPCGALSAIRANRDRYREEFDKWDSTNRGWLQTWWKNYYRNWEPSVKRGHDLYVLYDSAIDLMAEECRRVMEIWQQTGCYEPDNCRKRLNDDAPNEAITQGEPP